MGSDALHPRCHHAVVVIGGTWTILGVSFPSTSCGGPSTTRESHARDSAATRARDDVIRCQATDRVVGFDDADHGSRQVDPLARAHRRRTLLRFAFEPARELLRLRAIV